jgi:hypothetical protein
VTLVVHTQDGALNAIAKGVLVKVLQKLIEFQIPVDWWLKILKKVRRGEGRMV